jgi:hypothetical protein
MPGFVPNIPVTLESYGIFDKILWLHRLESILAVAITPNCGINLLVIWLT